jgi:hypothetical protein
MAATLKQTAAANARLNRVVHMSRSYDCRRERGLSATGACLVHVLWPMMASARRLAALVARSHTVDTFERISMALSFPNKSRAFDATRRAVRFWGYDSAMEVAFFVTEDALKRVQPDMQSDEAGLLRAFDSNRDLICRRAAKIYARGRKGSYDLVGADF